MASVMVWLAVVIVSAVGRTKPATYELLGPTKAVRNTSFAVLCAAYKVVSPGKCRVTRREYFRHLKCE